MKLQEKLNNCLFYIEPKVSLIKLQKVSDDYAIEFADWLVNKKLLKYDVYTNSSFEELLELFKKEKGL